MQIKRFKAKDVQEALREVQEIQGEEAIILSTRKIRRPASRPGSIDYPNPTSGHRVPEDIELATKGRVAKLILNQIQRN